MPLRHPQGAEGLTIERETARQVRKARAPSLSRSAERDTNDRKRYREERELAERRSMLRGLILLAVIVALIGMAIGGWERAFPAGWWRQW